MHGVLLGLGPDLRDARPVVVQREYLRRKDGGVFRTGRSDGNRRHRDSGGHLHRGVEGVHASQRGPFERHSDHRKRRVRRSEPRQVGRHPGCRNDYSIPFRLGALYKRRRLFRLPVGGGDPEIVGDAELREIVRATRHQLFVTLATEKDRNAPHRQIFAV